MATITIPSRLYQPGTYSFQASGFTGVAGSEIHVSMSVEAWPDVPLLATAAIFWPTVNPDGTPGRMGSNYTIPGRPIGRNGLVMPAVLMGVSVPVTGVPADVDITLLQAARTAITIKSD